jgi:hypothetical protein
MFYKVDSYLGDRKTKVGVTFGDQDRFALEEELWLVQANYSTLLDVKC